MRFSDSHFDVKNYTDIQGLAALRGELTRNKSNAQHEVAQQFESLLVQMLLKSMRDANKALSDGEGVGEQSELYQDLFDKQVSMAISGKGIGLAEKIESYLNGVQSVPNAQHAYRFEPEIVATQVAKAEKTADNIKNEPVLNPFDSQQSFIQRLMPYAKEAAKALNLDPKLMLAQAALETDWGKKIIAGIGSLSSHNLFNIKADPGWQKESASVHTMEQEGDALVKKKAAFRIYGSFAESFHDYVQFLQNNPRYQDALKVTHDPNQYLGMLQKANYATDQHYADKIMGIYNSKAFQQFFA